jgi:hypothetical protein
MGLRKTEKAKGFGPPKVMKMGSMRIAMLIGGKEWRRSLTLWSC